MAVLGQEWAKPAELQFDNVIEVQRRAPSFDARILRTHWRQSGIAAFTPSLPFIEMMLGTGGLISASYRAQPRPADLIRMGDVSFIPQDARLYYQPQPGSQRSLSCVFDIDRIAALTGAAWEWPEFDIDDALDIRNDYIRLGLRRIAEELVTPGFASSAQIETSLLFIAMEMQRVFRGAHDGPPRSSARFGRRELARLCEMVIDPDGEIKGLAELAEELGMCSRTLAATFRRTTGTTFRSFLAGARVEKAKMLLADRKLLIKQIAYDCGFQSCASFSAAFRNATGMTPESYRITIN